MTIRHPFQKLCCVPASESHDGPLLFAASGPNIFTFQLRSGKSTSRWSALEGPDHPLIKAIPNPNKRVKLDPNQDGSLSRQDSEESIEISVERQKGERRKLKVEQPKSCNVSHVLATSNGQTLLAVTTDDKTIHIFDIMGKGGLLVPKSSRSMPKRICAIVLDPEEQKIVVGDKFGDVYLLPLHPSEEYTQPEPSNETSEPSATELTVHTKGNLEALRQQREQKKIKPRKEGPDFDLKLLLGHVSLLTEVLVSKIEIGERSRAFVLTSDRDEHIRVSRYPQAHIIEVYCLGHRDFVSKLCIPQWAPQYLISGGGEPSIKSYEWPNGRVVDQNFLDKDTRPAIQEVLELSMGGRSFDKLAVSGLWAVSPGRSSVSVAERDGGIILVALEGMPLLLSLVLDADGKLRHHQILRVSGNVLDVAEACDEKLIIVSLDSAHVVGSTKVLDIDRSQANEMLVAFELVGEAMSGSEWRPAQIAGALNVATNQLESMSDVPQPENVERQRSKGEYSQLGEFLYGLENLRKWRGRAAGEAEGDMDDDEAPETIEE